MATKPTKLPRWATAPDAGDVVEPFESGATGSKDKGFKTGYKPPAQWENWLKNITYQWIQYLDDLANQAFTWTQSQIFQNGITSTQSTLNGNGATCTGNGTGAGGFFTGGAAGPAITCTGGAGTSAGIFTGGASGGNGITCTGGAGNGKGIVAVGNGTGSAVHATTGAGGGYAIQALPNIGSGGQGLFASADGSGVAVTAVSGANGAAIYAQAGGGNKPAIRAFGNGTGAAIQCESGNVAFIGTDPAPGADPGQNTACAASQGKVWVNLSTNGGGAITKHGDLGVSGVAITAGKIVITFARAFANVDYAVTHMGFDGNARFYSVENGGNGLNTCTIVVKDAAGSGIDPAAAAVKVMLTFHGRH